MNLLFWAAVVTGAGYLAMRGAGLSQLSNRYKVAVRPRIHSVTLSEIMLAFDVSFINPSNGTLTIKQPFVELYRRSPAPPAKPVLPANATGLQQKDWQTAVDAAAAWTKPAPLFFSSPSAKTVTILSNATTTFPTVFVPINYTNLMPLSAGYVVLKSILLSGKPTTLFTATYVEVSGLALPPFVEMVDIPAVKLSDSWRAILNQIFKL